MKKSGFTLVELLVVITIIAVLSAVAVLNLNSARDKTKVASAEATASDVYDAALYCLQQGESLTYDLTKTPSTCLTTGVGGRVSPPGTTMCPGVKWPDWTDSPIAYIYCKHTVDYEGFQITFVSADTNAFTQMVCRYNSGLANDNNCVTVY